MNQPSNRACTACLLAVLTLLPAVASASSAVVPGQRAAAAKAADGVALHAGRITGFDLKRGLLVVDGQVYRIDPRQTAFSDDRAEPPANGIASLRPGDKVVVRSQRTSGSPLVIQLVVQD
jgi:hypothetical protein